MNRPWKPDPKNREPQVALVQIVEEEPRLPQVAMVTITEEEPREPITVQTMFHPPKQVAPRASPHQDDLQDQAKMRNRRPGKKPGQYSAEEAGKLHGNKS